MERTFQEQIEREKAMKTRKEEVLQEQLEDAAMASHLIPQTLYWERFSDEVDQVAQQRNQPSESDTTDSVSTTSKSTSSASRGKPLKASNRAMVLVDETSGSQRDILLRSFRIDHALLTTQIDQIQKNMERSEKTRKSQEIVGKFLTEHNVWSILKTDD